MDALCALVPGLASADAASALHRAGGDVNVAANELLKEKVISDGAVEGVAAVCIIVDDENDAEIDSVVNVCSEPASIGTCSTGIASPSSMESEDAACMQSGKGLADLISEQMQCATSGSLVLQGGKEIRLSALAGLSLISTADVRRIVRGDANQICRERVTCLLQAVIACRPADALVSLARALLAMETEAPMKAHKSIQSQVQGSGNSKANAQGKAKARTKAKAKAKTRTSRHPATAWAAGTGFGGDYDDDDWEQTNAADLAAAGSRQDTADGALANNLNEVLEALREFPRSGFTDSIQLGFFPGFSMLVGGPLPSCMMGLLRNDSLMDIAGRPNVYHTLLALLKFVSSDRALAELLLLSDGESDRTPEHLLGNLLAQAKVFLANPNQISEAVDREDGAIESVSMAMALQENIELVQGNLVAIKTLRVDTPCISRKRSGDGATSSSKRPRTDDIAMRDLHTRYESQMGELRYDMVRIAIGGEWPHSYAKQIGKSKGCIGATTRRMKELSSMVTSLPVYWSSSIFVRTDEERTDVMKALIIGPSGTPYENGCFCFDLFLPPEYPNTNPLVQLVTTFGGKVRFNPNLYADGKVCLSLLGTWEGPGWNPRESTIMQVLVSIQSLILVPDPYFNEPGNESGHGQAGRKDKSEQYNRFIRNFTARVAMLEALKNPEPVFRDVIKRHFSLKREQVKHQVREWLSPVNAPPRKCSPQMDLGSGAYGTEVDAGVWRSSRRSSGLTDEGKDFDPSHVCEQMGNLLDAL